MLQSIIQIIVNILVSIMDIIPEPTEALTLGIPMAETIVWFIEILTLVNYILPVDDLIRMFIALMILHNFNLVWKVITRIWDALPLT